MSFVNVKILRHFKAFVCLTLVSMSASVPCFAHKEPAYTGRGPAIQILYAKRDVTENKSVVLADLGVELVDLKKVPMGTLTRPELAIGRKTFGLTKGQIINAADLYPLETVSEKKMTITIPQELFLKLHKNAVMEKQTDEAYALRLLKKGVAHQQRK